MANKRGDRGHLNKKQVIPEVKEIKKATMAIEQASVRGVVRLNKVVENIEKAEKKNHLVMAKESGQVEKQNKRIDQTVEDISKEAKRGADRLVRSANRIEGISRHNLIVTIWVSVGIAILSMILNIVLVIMNMR